MRSSLVVVGALVLGLASGCSDGVGPDRPVVTGAPTGSTAKVVEEFNFAGRVAGTGSLVAVAVRDGKALAYVCDGVSEAWLKGDVGGDGLVGLEGKGGQLVGSMGDEMVWGSVRVAGRVASFRASAVKAPGGLYRAASTTQELVAGWVVLPNGEQVGAVYYEGEVRPAPRIDPPQETVVIDGERLRLKSGVQQLAGG